jgi:hypothetical protein
MRKPDDKCKTPGRSAGERAGRSLEKNAVSASQVGLNGRHHIPERHHSRPLQPHFMIGLFKSRAPSRRVSAVGHGYRCAGSAAILILPCATRNLFGNNSHKPLACKRRLALKVRGLILGRNAISSGHTIPIESLADHKRTRPSVAQFTFR